MLQLSIYQIRRGILTFSNQISLYFSVEPKIEKNSKLILIFATCLFILQIPDAHVISLNSVKSFLVHNEHQQEEEREEQFPESEDENQQQYGTEDRKG